MGCTVEEAQERVGSREFSGWLAYWDFEPWEPGAADYWGSLQAAVLVNSHRRKGAASTRPEDLLPEWQRDEPEEADWRSIKQSMRGWVEAMGGEFVKIESPEGPAPSGPGCGTMPS